MASRKFAWLTILVVCASTGCETTFAGVPGQGAGGFGAMMDFGNGGSPGGGFGAEGGASGTGSGLASGQAGTSAPGGGAAGVTSSSTGGAGKSGGPSGGTNGGGFPGTGAGEGVAGAGTAGLPAQGGGPGAGGGMGAGGAPPMQTCPAQSVLQAGSTKTDSITVGGTTRSYVVHVPMSYTGKTAVPLVTDWHPILFTDTFEQGISGYQAKSDQEGFIVVWPQGIDNAWNVGPCCTTSRTVDDVGFAKALIAKLETQACIDPKRVYAVGYSMGGGMSLDLACNAADVIAAIAPAAFDLMADSNNWPCHPARPISVIDFRSTGDPIVPFAGGATNPPNGLPVTITFLGANSTFQKLAQLDQCTGSPTDNSALGAGCQTYTQCAQGVQVTLCTKQGGGHDPGDPAVAWNVLKNFTLP